MKNVVAEMKNKNNIQSCCQKSYEKKSRAFWLGLIYGLAPHVGCISFILFGVFGTTIAFAFLKPLFINPYIFHILIGLSFIFATISGIIYLRKNMLFSLLGVKKKWKYLFTLYVTTILINIIMLTVVFPYFTNAMSNKVALNRMFFQNSQQVFSIQVEIPCSGHGPLITSELYGISGIKSVKFEFPNKFVISYNPAETTKRKILSLNIFKTYKATVLNSQANFATP